MSLYNEDELVPPIWINEKFLKDVLTTCENNGNIEIANYDLSPASLKGDHFASIMFRCKVTYRLAESNIPLEKRMIIKTLPEKEGQKREFLMETKLFETEIDMYTKTLPEIEKILKENGESTKLAAKIFYYSLVPHKVIVLEDLCESGYNTVRFRHLTEEEIKEVYRKIAKLHAVSYMLGHSADHEIVTQHQNGLFNNDIAMLNDLIDNGLRHFGNLLSSSLEFRKYNEKFMLLKGDVQKVCKDMSNAYKSNTDTDDIFVLNHGDFHMKNIMFKFDNQNVLEDLIMVDYQISCYGPSIIDTIYSQYLMLSSNLRLNRNELMEYYFSEFIRVLRKINFRGKLPTYDQFQKSALKYRHYTIYCLAVLLPVVAVFIGGSEEEIKDTDSDKLFESPEMIADTYHRPQFLEEIRRLLPQLLKEGYFDKEF